ncbi:transposase (plasmid) [Streptomyces globisporus]|uniref:IS66 family transposase n=1 Tax=Streptomyces globisporus TaxID=1908 RepID=UPI002F91849C|nr:transposase [Streptomyces globisporus]
MSEHPRADGRKQSTARNLLERLRDQAHDVLRYADGPHHVPFTNNCGERALRPVKTQLKISGCHQSEHGDGLAHGALLPGLRPQARHQRLQSPPPRHHRQPLDAPIEQTA